jgi:hypothetical protein
MYFLLACLGNPYTYENLFSCRPVRTYKGLTSLKQSVRITMITNNCFTISLNLFIVFLRDLYRVLCSNKALFAFWLENKLFYRKLKIIEHFLLLEVLFISELFNFHKHEFKAILKEPQSISIFKACYAMCAISSLLIY